MKIGVALVFAACAGCALGQSIIPAPRSMTRQSGAFSFDIDTGIDADAGSLRVARMIQQELRPATGYDFPIGSASKDAIHLRIDPKVAALGPEGYRLKVTPNGIDIASAGWQGVYYGTRTLLQLLPPDVFRRSLASGVRWQVPCVTIEDSPRFGWRGAMMDVSRHFEQKAFVLKFLDLLALHKMNVFHWHLVDDNGWRVEIKQYPKLTEVGSHYDFSAMNPTEATRSPSTPVGGFYTQEDIREVVRYAADRNITVVPEIEMPGHSGAAITSYPALGNVGEVKAGGGDAGFYDNVYNVDDSTITFLHNVLDEIMALFPSQFIHVGGDEVWKEPWHRNPQAQARMKALGLKSEDELQSWFIKQMDDYLVAHGRRLVGWDEILEGGLAPNATVMSWRGIDGGIAAAQQGHDVVMAPTSNTYLDYAQGRIRSLEPTPTGGYLPLETVYGFEPIPPALTAEQAKHVLGCQGQLWSEMIPNPAHMEYMAYPRLCALAEVAWSPKESKNYDDFLVRLKDHLKRLDVLNVQYRPLAGQAPPPVGAWKSGEIGEDWIAKSIDLPTQMTMPGDYKVIFNYTDGAMRLDMKDVQIMEDGVAVASDDHEGRTGAQDVGNVYKFHIPAIKPGAKYTLRAMVRVDGGNDSAGDVYLIKTP